MVLLLAKGIELVGHHVEFSFWTVLAYVWQDLLVVLVFAGLETVLRHRQIGWIIYGGLVLYTAFNVPVVRVLSSPMTWAMMRAARGPLADSIKHHLTAPNLMLMATVLAVGIALPVLLARRPYLPRSRDLAQRCGSRPFWVIAAFAGMLLAVALGPAATARSETMGLHRNALVALVTTIVPRISSKASTGDWRASPFESHQSDDLSHYRGAAAGWNVVMILLESTGARYLKPYGAREDPMPNVTAIARNALLFENAYSVYPESIKGLFSVLCSRYPAMDTTPELYRYVTSPSLAAVLAAAGYHTALFHSGRFGYLGMEAVVQDRGFQTLEDAGEISGDHQSSFGVDEPATVRRMLAWLDALPRTSRFFITYLPIAGHHPYDSPEPGPFPSSDEQNCYRNALHYGDAALGEFLNGLRQRGLEENTLFVIFGDHGEAFGQHEGNYGHTLFLYDENIHVPFLIAAPNLLRGPVRVGRVVSLIDTMPTILDLLSLPIPASCQGQSLLTDQPRMALCLTDYSLGLLGLRDGSWKFIYELDSRHPQLFDLRTDPQEKQDLAPRFPGRAATYLETLKRWAAAQRQSVLECARD